MINRCIGCHYYDSKENVCTHGSPIFIDDICTDYQDSEFVKQIRAEVIDEFVELINTMPTYENENGEIMPMPVEMMAEQLKGAEG